MFKRIMPELSYDNGEVYFEGVPLSQLAEEFGTPAYVYSRAHIEKQYSNFYTAFEDFNPIVAYAVKANYNIELLKILASLGCGADVVSGGELFIARKAGIPARKIVFNGNGKTEKELETAIAEDILLINADNFEEVEAISDIAQRLGKKARVAFRINPDIDPKTHPYISTGLKNSKFGIPYNQAMDLYARAAKLPNIEMVGVHAHLGSQIMDLSPLVEGVQKMAELIYSLRRAGHNIQYYDLGGGIGIRYFDEAPPTPKEYAEKIGAILAELKVTPIFEPGRYLVGNSGLLLAKVLYIKETGQKRFVVVDAAMNDLIRPAFYEAYHHIISLSDPIANAAAAIDTDVVGPICESGDFLGKNRQLPELHKGELIAVLSAGAYGFSMSSNYNARLRPAEILVNGQNYRVIRARETLENLL